MSTSTTIMIDGGALTAADVVAVAHRRATATIADSVDARMAPAKALVERLVDGGGVVYGVTTGFGALANTRVSRAQAVTMQYALLRSHAAGVGRMLPRHLVRAMLLLRARTLTQGHSGVRPDLPRFYVELLARDLLPVVPAQGSVGASGDLAPFAHLALPLVGEGELDDGDGARPARELLDRHGLAPLELEPKEGLALLNGTEGMLAMGVLELDRAQRLARAADVACACSIEALLGSVRPLREEIHRLRPHPGQATSAANMRRLLEGSPGVASHHDDFDHAVQDAYSLRCAPQVHGAVRDTLAHAERVFTTELGAVVDNPLVLPAGVGAGGDSDGGEVVSGGNFHGQPLAFALDFMTIAATELGSISERRTDRILDPQRSSGLPPFLAVNPGVNSGLMLAQYTAAALVAESRVLCHPASVESIPTSGSQEDHVSMGFGAGRKLGDVLDNTARVVAVELLCAAEGLRHRTPGPAVGTRAAWEAIQALAPARDDDRTVGDEIEAVTALIEDGELDRVVADAVGALA